MKLILTLFFAILAFSCTQTKENQRIFIIDNGLKDITKAQLQFVSDNTFSQFKTPIEARYYLNKQLIDSIIQPDFKMISWYTNNKDTIDLVAHIGEFETSALLLRFIGSKPQIFYYRASHSGQPYFRKRESDVFANEIEVEPISFNLRISEIPDTINKQVIFGQIEMESYGYYDKRDASQREHKIKMKFNFRSQFRKFD